MAVTMKNAVFRDIKPFSLEYLHRNPASRKRRRRRNPVSNETVIYSYGSFATLTTE
jgi:hypothetical protein